MLDSGYKYEDSVQSKKIRDIIYKSLENNNGILRLKPAWVARQGFSSGRNFGLNEKEYNKCERGEITERWIGSTTKAENKIGPEDEGLSYIFLENDLSLTLKEAIYHAKELIMGEKYSQKYKDLGRLIKVLDCADRINFHYHQIDKDAALVGRKSKEEAYYFPVEAPLGPHPETFFGVHPYIVEQKKYDIILSHLIEWNSDLILRHSRAYIQVRDDGFHLPAGIPHAPGSALTIELQEDSDVYGNLQALYRGKIFSKDTLFHDIREEDKKKFGEKIVIYQIDWEKSGDPYFYENRRTPPILIKESIQVGGEEYWIFYNSKKFSGKKLIVYPNSDYLSKDRGAYTILVWKGRGKIDGCFIEAGNFNYDELIISYDKATRLLKVENNGNEDLQIFKFFGPDINSDVPMLSLYKK